MWSSVALTCGITGLHAEHALDALFSFDASFLSGQIPSISRPSRLYVRPPEPSTMSIRWGSRTYDPSSAHDGISAMRLSRRARMERMEMANSF